jgi:dachs protein
MLDTECSLRGTAESYVTKIKLQHHNSPRLELKNSETHNPTTFIIKHFAGNVEYDTTDFLETNRDIIPDDLVSVFYKHTCNFGFATHLFGSELKALYASGPVPRGLSFRIAPTSQTDLLNGDEPVSTLTQDFHTRLDNLLRTLVHARPHFVRCIRSNYSSAEGSFERSAVINQVRALQVLETVNLMAGGYPHRTRFKQFINRYKMLAPLTIQIRTEEKILEDCKVILHFVLEKHKEQENAILSWAPGKKHIFLSEGMRQCLENMRSTIRNKSAITIQSLFRGYYLRQKLGISKYAGNHFLSLKKISSGPNNSSKKNSIIIFY